MIDRKVVDEISLSFPELIIIGKYVEIRLKNRRPPYQKIKNITRIEQKRLLFLHSWFHFYGFSLAKTDLHNKYTVNFKFG